MKALLAALLASVSSAALAQTAPIYESIAYGSANVAAGPVTIKAPAGTQNGDLLLAYIATQTTNGSWITAPAGWTQVIKTFNTSQGSQLFYRIANNEPASYTWSNTSYPQGAIRTYRGVNPTNPVDVSAGCTSAGGISCQIPAMADTVVAGEKYVAFWDFSNIAEVIYGPADLSNNHYDLVQRSMISGDKTLPAGGTTVPAETATVRGAANHWDGIAVTLRPIGSNLPQPPVGVKADSANDFLNTLGVNIGPSPNAGATIAQYTTMLNYIGVRNVRGSSAHGYPLSAIITLAQSTNTKFIFGLESKPDTTTANLTNVEVADAKQLANAGVLLALEGANETDQWSVTYNGVCGGGPGSRCGPWHGSVDYLQRDWYAAVKADPVLKNYPVYSSTDVGGETENDGLQWIKIPSGALTTMPVGTTYADYANSHNYVIWRNAPGMVDNIAWCMAGPTNRNCPPGPQGYTWYQDFMVAWAFHHLGYTAAQAPSVPKVTTETGWTTSNGGAENQGKVLINVYLAQFKQGWAYTFIYQLKDNDGGFTNTFGMFDPNNNAKLAATYLHNLTTILNDKTNFTPGTLNYSIPSEPATVHDLLLQKGSGAFELVVWDERPIGEATDTVAVNLGGLHGTVNLYDPTVSSSVMKTLSNVSSVALALTDHPLIVEVIK